MVPEPILDPVAISELRIKAEGQPISAELVQKFEGDPKQLGEWLAQEYGLLIKPCYAVIYTIEQQGVHLRIKSVLPFLQVTLLQAEPIAEAFGMGDRQQWQCEDIDGEMLLRPINADT